MIGLDPVAGTGRDQRRRDHLASHPEITQLTGQLVSGRESRAEPWEASLGAARWARSESREPAR